MKIVNTQEFNELMNEKAVLVDFFATWCGPCKMLSPVLEEIAEKFPRIKVVKVDIDQFDDLTRAHGIMSVPTIEVYRNGALVKKEVGYHNLDEIVSWLPRD